MILGIVLAILVAGSVSMYVGWRERTRMRNLADVLPVTRGGRAEVRSDVEFSASTAATTVSLATVILAYFELAPYLGPWLFWTVITTGAGIAVVRLTATPLLQKLSSYAPHVPSLHEFLGSEFNSSRLQLVAGLCTSLGFLGAMAVELTVGSRFLAQFLPAIPPTILVCALAAVGVTYTALGGFRAVIVTDRIQMVGIWLMAGMLSLLYALYFVGHPQVLAPAARAMTDFSHRDGLSSFLLGIFIINVPTFLADMSMWQRIGGTSRVEDTRRGLLRSVGGVTAIWAVLCALAVVGPQLQGANAGSNALVAILMNLQTWIPGWVIPLIVCVVATGLLCAMFSTASTQLIAFVHAAHEDVLRRVRPSLSNTETTSSRLILVIASSIAVMIVEGLTRMGLSIADLVFGVYGSQLGLVPAVALALFGNRERLRGLGGWVLAGVALAFPVGWGLAIAGRIYGNSNLTFLAPVGSLATSLVMLIFGFLVRSGRRSDHISNGAHLRRGTRSS